MKRALSAWNRPPRTLQRPATRLDNLVLVPASELASLQLWQRRARLLPPGNTLMVLPSDNLELHRVGRRIRMALEQQGRRSTIVTVPGPAAREGETAAADRSPIARAGHRSLS